MTITKVRKGVYQAKQSWPLFFIHTIGRSRTEVINKALQIMADNHAF